LSRTIKVKNDKPNNVTPFESHYRLYLREMVNISCVLHIHIYILLLLTRWQEQGSILELFRQCSILELFRQCSILELFRQCSILLFFIVLSLKWHKIYTYIYIACINVIWVFYIFNNRKYHPVLVIWLLCNK
jgi:hypothetical protein